MKFFKSTAISILCILLIAGAISFSQKTAPEADRYKINAPDQDWVDKTLASLSPREKIGQLIHVRVRGDFLNRQSEEFRELKETIEKHKVGGVVLFAGNIYESALLLNELQSYSELPLLVSSDFERGASFRIADTTSFPYTMALGATASEEFARRQGEITARESRALGVHWLFAPVVDVNNNPKNPVINIRSFGEDPELVARLGSAFIRGARSEGVLTTAKHFPGHGDTATDTHIGLAVVESDLDRLNSTELVPFRSAIEAGVDAVMTAHVAVPKITGEPEIPATLSKKILTDLLRGILGFEGIVVTDAMEMGGITNKYWCGLAAVSAIRAGADIVLLPTDNAVAINEIERAIEMGHISPEQIDRSVEKILRAKSSLGLHRNRTVPIDRLAEAVSTPENHSLAQQIADHSITAVKDRKKLLPVDPTENPTVYSLVLDSGLATSPGYEFRSEMREMFPSMISEWANSQITSEQIRSIERNAKRSDLIVCSTFARLSSSGNTIGIPNDQRTIIRKLLATGKPIIWVAFGNPYVIQAFPEIGTYLCTFSYSDVSQRAAARAISGAIPVTGKMPVSIPDHAAFGTGLQIPKLDMELKPVPDEAPNSSSNTFNNTRQILSEYIHSKVFANTKLLVGHNNAAILDIDLNNSAEFSIDPHDPSIRTDWYKDFYSAGINVIISTMMMSESGRLILDAPVQDYLPEQQDTELGKVPISELLTDISGTRKGTGGSAFDNLFLIGEIVSRVSENSAINTLIKQLNLPPRSEYRDGTNPTTSDEMDFPYATWTYAVLSQTLLNKGIYNHQRILKPDTIARFTSPGNKQKTIGWIKPAKTEWTGRLFSSEAFGYMDSKGSLLWIDPEKELFIILMVSPEEADEAAVQDAYEKITLSILDEIN